MKDILGIHHITAIAGDPQANLDFYVGVLGLRFIKKTVNFDDPNTYHFYFGDEAGHPGTILTFFAWGDAPRGRRGTGQATVTSFSVAENALGYWTERFKKLKVRFEPPLERFDEGVITFYDPDDLRLEIVAHANTNAARAWEQDAIPFDYALRGFRGVTLTEEGYEQTAFILSELGFRVVSEEGNRIRFAHFQTGEEVADVVVSPDAARGVVQVGTVHHVAWRAVDDASQKEWRKKIAGLGLNVTAVIDRQYFHSIYFREPGGVLFEIATDPPGFAIDEAPSELGTGLKLPSQYEQFRAQLEQTLTKVRVPSVVK